MEKISFWGLVLFLMMGFAACESDDGPDTLVRIHKDEFSLEDQQIIGREVKNYMIKNPLLFPMLDRTTYSEVYNYVDVLMGTLINTTTISTREDFEWEVVILQDDEIRSAFAAPGGKIFIYTGLLKFIKAENELMTILAHEIAYVESQKLMNYLAAKYSKDLFFLGDILLGNEVDGMNELCNYLKDLIYSPEEVIVADDFAIDLICPFQYNALGMKSILDDAADFSSEILWLNVRPSAANRVENIIAKADICGDEEDPTFDERYEGYKNQLP